MACRVLGAKSYNDPMMTYHTPCIQGIGDIMDSSLPPHQMV